MSQTDHRLGYDLRRLHAEGFTSTAFTAKTPTTTAPSGNAVFDLQSDDFGYAIAKTALVDQYVLVIPYGSDANDETFDIRVWGWSQCKAVDGLWVPVLLFQGNVVLGNIAATALGANHFLADTITLVDGNGDLAEVISPENDTPACVRIETLGCQRIEFDFDSTGAAAMNVLLRPYS